MPNPPYDSDDPPPVEPAWPDDGACCGNGCDPCIYDLFDVAHQRYLVRLREWQERQACQRSGEPRR